MVQQHIASRSAIAMLHVASGLARCLALALAIGACTPLGSPMPASPATTASGSHPPTGTTASPELSTPPIVRDLYDEAGVGWESQFVFMEPHGLGRIKGLVAGGPGFVFWSDEADGRPGFLLGGADGSWEQIDSTLTGRVMLAVVAGPSGLVGLAALGQDGIETWTSTDGRTWVTAPTTGIDGIPSALLATSSGFVAAGSEGSGCGLATWTSVDAVSWKPAGELPTGLKTCTSGDAPAVEQLVASSPGLLALGHTIGPEKSAWTSVDGRTWQRMQDPPTGGISGITAFGSGYLAVGHDGKTPPGAAAWISPDGVTWIAAPTQAAFADSTMAAVVSLADGSVVGVGSGPADARGLTFVAWTSSDGLTWTRSPGPLCPSVTVCDAPGPGPLLLARSGDRLAAFDGGINILQSPRLTPGMRPGTLTLGFDQAPAGTWASGPVAGFCAMATDHSGSVAYGAGYPRLTDVGPAFGSSTYTPELELVLGPGPILQLLRYDRGDDAGFTVEPGVPGAGPVTVGAGSTNLEGRLEFRHLSIIRDDPGLPPVSPVSGWVRWSCD